MLLSLQACSLVFGPPSSEMLHSQPFTSFSILNPNKRPWKVCAPSQLLANVWFNIGAAMNAVIQMCGCYNRGFPDRKIHGPDQKIVFCKLVVMNYSTGMEWLNAILECNFFARIYFSPRLYIIFFFPCLSSIPVSVARGSTLGPWKVEHRVEWRCWTLLWGGEIIKR